MAAFRVIGAVNHSVRVPDEMMEERLSTEEASFYSSEIPEAYGVFEDGMRRKEYFQTLVRNGILEEVEDNG